MITTYKDIVRESSKKTNVSELVVSKIFDFHLEYINERSQEFDVYTIQLPYVGTLYLKKAGLQLKRRNLKKVIVKSKRKKRGKTSIGKTGVITSKIDVLNNFNTNMRKKSLHSKKPMLEYDWLTDGLDIYQIQEKQNRYADEREGE